MCAFFSLSVESVQFVDHSSLFNKWKTSKKFPWIAYRKATQKDPKDYFGCEMCSKWYSNWKVSASAEHDESQVHKTNASVKKMALPRIDVNLETVTDRQFIALQNAFRCLYHVCKNDLALRRYPAERALCESCGVDFSLLKAGNLTYTSWDFIEEAVPIIANMYRNKVCV
jgi:hypothetical protein